MWIKTEGPGNCWSIYDADPNVLDSEYPEYRVRQTGTVVAVKAGGKWTCMGTRRWGVASEEEISMFEATPRGNDLAEIRRAK
jgi:hypothetical protein